MEIGTAMILACELSARRAVGGATTLCLSDNTDLLPLLQADEPERRQSWATLCGAIAASDLSTVIMDNIGMDETAAAVLGQQLAEPGIPAVSDLSLAGNQSVGQEGAASLATMLLASAHLRHIRFGPNDGVRVPTNRSELMVLDVSAQSLGPQECTLLPSVVASNTGLVSLNLSGNPLTGGEMAWDDKSQEYSVCMPGSNNIGFRELTKAMTHSKIQTVDLDNCGLMSSSCECLAAFVEESTHLQGSRMFQNKIEDDGLASVIAAAERNASIRTIVGLFAGGEIVADWSSLRIGTVGCKIIAAELTLERNSEHLTHMSVAGNFIGGSKISLPPGTVSVEVARGVFAKMDDSWGEFISDPEDGE